jgi:hypothetical protein
MRHAAAGFRVTAVKMMLHFIIAQSEGFVMGVSAASAGDPA